MLLVADHITDDFAGREIDRTICRLDGPIVLLHTLQELTLRVVAISSGSRRSASETRFQSRNLRERLTAMRFKVLRLQEAIGRANKRRRS